MGIWHFVSAFKWQIVIKRYFLFVDHLWWDILDSYCCCCCCCWYYDWSCWDIWCFEGDVGTGTKSSNLAERNGQTAVRQCQTVRKNKVPSRLRIKGRNLHILRKHSFYILSFLSWIRFIGSFPLELSYNNKGWVAEWCLPCVRNAILSEYYIHWLTWSLPMQDQKCCLTGSTALTTMDYGLITRVLQTGAWGSVVNFLDGA